MCDDRDSRALTERRGEPEEEPRTLRLHPDPVLRARCEPVERFDSWLADVLEEMLALMRLHDGIGLAGPQAGLTKRLFVMELEGQTLRLVNPVILARGGQDHMVEGCLSLPGITVGIERALHTEVHGQDARGKQHEYHVEGLWARVMQHEIDHLDGVMICDYQDPGAHRNRELEEQ